MQEIKEKQESSVQSSAELDVTDEQCVCCPKCQSTDIEIEEEFSGDFGKCNKCGITFQVRTIVKEVRTCR